MEVLYKGSHGSDIRIALLTDGEYFGETEFVLRDKVLRMGAQALEATINDRKKGGTKAAVPSARSAAKTRVLSAGGRGMS